MSQYKEANVGDTVYFWFAANTTAGAAGDGATPLYDVRLGGAAAGAAPTASGTPTLLTHANYTDGLHEIAVDTTGYAAGEYAVFCTLTISTVNPAGFVGSVKVRAAGEPLYVGTTPVYAVTDDGKRIAAAVDVAATGIVEEYLPGVHADSKVTTGDSTGAFSAGDISNLSALDANTVTIGESAGGIDAQLRFSGIESVDVPSEVHIYGRYEGNVSHWVAVQAWNYRTGAWEYLAPNTATAMMGHTTTEQHYRFPLRQAHFDNVNGVTLIRFLHVGTGNNAHTGLVLNKVNCDFTYAEGLGDTVQAAMTAQGYTTGRAPNLDNLDAAVSAIPTADAATPAAAAQTAAEAVQGYIEGMTVDGAGAVFTGEALANAPGGGTGLTAQETRDAMLLDPSGWAGDPDTGGLDQQIASAPLTAQETRDAMLLDPTGWGGFEGDGGLDQQVDAIKTQVELLRDSNSFTADLAAAEFQTFDWDTDATITASYSEEIPAGMDIRLYYRDSSGGGGEIGTLNSDGFTPDSNPMPYGVGVLVAHPGCYGLGTFPAGILTLTADVGRFLPGPRTVSLALPAFIGTQIHFAWDRYGVPTMLKVGRVAVEAAPGAVDNAAIAAAVRDVDNSSPAPGSLGEAVNAGGGGEDDDSAMVAAIEDLTQRVEQMLSTGLAVQTARGSGMVGAQLINNLFNTLRAMFQDSGAEVYKNTLLVPLYNRVVEEINSVLMQLSAEIAMDRITVIGDGVNSTFELPANFLAFVPTQVRHRSPATATSNYTMGAALRQLDQFDTNMKQVVTDVAAPKGFVLVVAGDTQYIKFNSIPVENEIIDGLYFYQPTKATESNVASEYTPWAGLLDNLIMRMLEHYVREGLEFTNEARAMWVARTTADVAMLLGLRHLQTNTINPSSWFKVPTRG